MNSPHSTPLQNRAEISVTNLRCEYRTDPLGVDVPYSRLSWVLAAAESSVRGVHQAAYQIQVASSRDALAKGEADLWDSGKVASDITNQIAYEGKPLAAGLECWWQVRVFDAAGEVLAVSAPARWTVGLQGWANWKAEWIGLQRPEAKPPAGQPAAYLRKTFESAKPVRRALVFASALGDYALHLNGKRVGDDYFTPGYTDYHKTLYYNTYDVTSLLQDGANAIGGILADGWYAGAMGWGHRRDVFGDQPLLSVQLDIEFVDGTRQQIVTDGSWKASFGPILEADQLGGCVYDARKELPGWDTIAFDDAAWTAPVVGAKPTASLSAYPGEPVRRIQELAAKTVAEPTPGVFIFDMGQNMVGWVRLKIKGAPGQQVVLRFGEMLNDDGTLYTANLRSARATDTFFLKGTGSDELLETFFTFHGFRYVEVTGVKDLPTAEMVTGVVVHSDLPQTGFFECSQPLINQLFSNICWGMRGNYLEIPTDCPQRDERMGWTGDAQVFIRTGTYIRDIASFFTKWMVDMEDAQLEDGHFTDVAPLGVTAKCGAAGWGDAGVICPWTVYQVYGDTRILERHYRAMAAWIDYLQANSIELLRPAVGYGDWLAPFDPKWSGDFSKIAAAEGYGDVVPPFAETPKDFLGTAFFAHSTDLMAQTARVLGKTADAEKYEALFAQIREAFCKAYLAPDGTLLGDTQTVYIIALRFNLVPEALRPEMARRLIAKIEECNWHLGTGFLGINLLMPTLTDIGRDDVAYRLLENTTYPSWGYSIVNGATTIWERWNSYTKATGFGDVGMNSFNHYAYGSVGEWMFATLAGIDTDGPGFRRLVIKPHPGGSLTYAKASYDSINGTVASDWKLEGGKFTLKVTVPCNTTATVHVPAKNGETVTEGGKPASEAAGVKFLCMENGAAVFEVGSGRYEFVAQ